MFLTTFKENARQYTLLEKMEIASLAVHGGVMKNISANFHISQPTLRRWRDRYLIASGGFKRKSKEKSLPIVNNELHEMEISAKDKLILLLPKDMTAKIKKAGEYQNHCIRLLQNRQYANIIDACKTLGIAPGTFYEKRELQLTDKRREFPALMVLDLLLENKSLDKDSIIRKLSGEGIPLTRKEAGNLRWQANRYITKYQLREKPAVYMFLNTDDAWCMDFMHLYGEDGSVKYLLKVIDDRSHMDITNVLLDHATTANVVQALKDAFIQKGRIPASIKTDRGCQFRVQFGNFLKQHTIEHFKSYPRYPQFNAKVERRFREVNSFFISNRNSTIPAENLVHLEANIHNYIRPHSELLGLTPCEAYWKGADPPFKHPNAKIESVSNWFPKSETGLEIIISI